MAVNLTGVFRCMTEEIVAMLGNGGGSIVNVASVAGVIGFARHSAYSAGKHGVIASNKGSKPACPSAVSEPRKRSPPPTAA
jgi:NAD(P)-dependent dehydrogenase (short-subunit alcohol dehydrogenase family)